MRAKLWNFFRHMNQCKIRLLFVVFYFLINTSFAQIAYNPGTVKLQSGEILEGQVYFSFSTYNKEQIVYFKKGKGKQKETRKLTVNDVSRFTSGNQIFYKAIIENELSEDNVHFMDYDSEFKIRLDTVFLRQLTKGKIKLFELVNEKDKALYYVKEGSDFQLLYYKRYKKEQEFNDKVMYRRKFLGQLKLYFQQCPEVLNSMQNIRYEKEILVKLVRKYNQCVSNK